MIRPSFAHSLSLQNDHADCPRVPPLAPPPAPTPSHTQRMHPFSLVPAFTHFSASSGGNVAKWAPLKEYVAIVQTLRRLAPMGFWSNSPLSGRSATPGCCDVGLVPWKWNLYHRFRCRAVRHSNGIRHYHRNTWPISSAVNLLMGRRGPVRDAFRHGVGLVPNDFTPKPPAIRLQGEGDTSAGIIMRSFGLRPAPLAVAEATLLPFLFPHEPNPPPSYWSALGSRAVAICTGIRIPIIQPARPVRPQHPPTSRKTSTKLLTCSSKVGSNPIMPGSPP